ncbi:MAG: hypothetical protein C0596_09815 [Marinilabiliales bacterium]|nr:MAG: hypothetical protein C0596_09815 [Marinilabiliales bacterium]
MKKTNVFFIMSVFAFFLFSCGGAETTSESTEKGKNTTEEEVVQADPPKSAEELRDIDKMDENEIAEAENKDEVYRFSSSYSLNEFPMEVLEAKNLQTIELNNYYGTTLPEELKNLPNLQVLYISGGTKMTELPAFLPELKNLKTFAITAANTLDLNAAFKILSQCENLENVQITFSEVESELPTEIGNMEKLRVLDISNNQISVFPEEFFSLPNLYSLKITSNEDYRYDYDMLFEKMVNLPKLERLAIYYSGLSGLPEVFNEYPVLNNIKWREEGADWADSDKVTATTDKWNEKFPNIEISWSTSSSLFYDMY